ncbi:hypothetical protein DIURU_002279 [Diutina rugosa]|uniref:Sterol regulatory element-binding protein cleavage-activating protein n=1 Tax=Diutina rugosa TaxID=5481 RepID=A0A642UQZ1_DIURU|nr:uncharacterized protein DIURU_002279 [Diutina rugosa]KAA8903767.1 hypothetical protein DIURU_002279 [Diutina rugosa]
MSTPVPVRAWSQGWAVRWINTVVRWPRAVTLVPVVIVFLLAYPVIYQHLIKEVNSSLARRFGGCSPTPIEALAPVCARDTTTDTLYHLQYKAANVLTSSLLDHVDNLTLRPPSEWGAAAIVSPVLGTSHQLKSASSVLKHINYNLSPSLVAMFFDNVNLTNYMVTAARTLNVFVLSSNANLNETIASLPGPVSLVGSTTSSTDIAKFVGFYCSQMGYPTWYNLAVRALTWLVRVSLVGYYLYIYLSLANQHHVHSIVSVMVCWVAQTVLAATSAITLEVLLRREPGWQHIFSPSIRFSHTAYALMVTVMSSRSFFAAIDSVVSSQGMPLHRRLYRYYTSATPMITTARQLLQIAGIYGLGRLLLAGYISPEYYPYTTARFERVAEALMLAIIINYGLSVTFMIGVLVVDSWKAQSSQQEAELNRSYIADDIDDDDDTTTNGPQREDIMDSTNVVSCFFLTRNPRLSQWLLKIGYTDDELVKSAVVAVVFKVIFLTWLVYIRVPLANVGPATVTVSRRTILYYLELASVLTLMVALSLIMFRLVLPETDPDIPLLTPADFAPEKKRFNSIELRQPAHTLDIIQLKTNSHTSFVVSVGLDHRIFIWSPLAANTDPVNIATTIGAPLTGDSASQSPQLIVEGDESSSSSSPSSPSAVFDPTVPPKSTPFWPINHVNISDDGNYIVLINYRYGLIKCYERKQLAYIWEIPLPQGICRQGKVRIVESFFRRKTVPGFLARKILQKKKSMRQAQGASGSSSSASSRRGSAVSLTSLNSAINGNFPVTADDDLRELQKDEFIIVFDTGQLVVISCSEGSMKQSNILSSVFADDDQSDLKIVSAKKMMTPRVTDRIVCQVSSMPDLIVATVVNNNWKFRRVPVRGGHYNQALITTGYMSPMTPSPSVSAVNKNDFTAIARSESASSTLPSKRLGSSTPLVVRDSAVQINRPTIVTVEFVGMIVRVKNMTAEIIDVQTGIILKTFNVGRFKPSSFRVAHSEPTHCKFCGCASIQSFSIVYEDHDTPMIILHTFTIDIPRSKNYICLRVERDPREIRCIGFNAVTEHQYWFDDVVGWELTDVNMIIGFRKSKPTSPATNTSKTSGKASAFERLIHDTSLQSLRHRRQPATSASTTEADAQGCTWEGFIITASDGNLINYDIPPDTALASTRAPDICCISKYGYKSVIVNVGAGLQILYLGNDKLVEDDIYYSGNQADVWSILEDQASKGPAQSSPLYARPRPNQTINSELLFINKRARNRDKHRALA